MAGLGDTAKLLASLFLDTSNYSAGTAKAIKDTTAMESSFSRAHKGVSLLHTALGTGVGFVGAQVATRVVGGLLSTVKEAAFGMNASLETSTLQFETLMGNADQARAHVQMLFAFAAKTPFETAPIIEASRIMRTFGGAALDTEANLTKFGDAAAATSADINEVAQWSSRLYAAIQGGQPFGEATQRLMELGVITPEVRTKLEAAAAATGKLGSGAADAALALKDAQLKVKEATADYSTAVKKSGSSSLDAQRAAITLTKAQNALADQTKAANAAAKGGGDAWSIYLASLGRYSGAMGKQANTWAGLTSSIHDNIMLMSATALKPVFDTAKEGMSELLTFMSTPEATAGVAQFADSLGKVINPENLKSVPWAEIASSALAAGKGLAAFAGSVPWGTLGETMKIAGQATKVALDAFMALPEPLKAAVIGAIAVNKLTGGGLMDIVKVAGGMVGGLRGSSPATPVFVSAVGGLGGGAGVPGAAPVAGAGGGILGKVAIVGSVALAAGSLYELYQTWDSTSRGVAQTKDTTNAQLDAWNKLPTSLDENTAALKREIAVYNEGNANPLGYFALHTSFAQPEMAKSLQIAADKIANGSEISPEGIQSLKDALAVANDMGNADLSRIISADLAIALTKPQASKGAPASLDRPGDMIAASKAAGYGARPGDAIAAGKDKTSKETVAAVNRAANNARDDVHRQLAGTLDSKRAITDGLNILKVYTSGTAEATRGTKGAMDWAGRNIDILKALQQRFAAAGDTATAAALGADITALQTELRNKQMSANVTVNVSTAVSIRDVNYQRQVAFNYGVKLAQVQ